MKSGVGPQWDCVAEKVDGHLRPPISGAEKFKKLLAPHHLNKLEICAPQLGRFVLSAGGSGPLLVCWARAVFDSGAHLHTHGDGGAASQSFVSSPFVRVHSSGPFRSFRLRFKVAALEAGF
jgi:hypothetical protein